jgi:hypothetical protein
MDIAAWLQDLELQRHVSAFRDNDITARKAIQGCYRITRAWHEVC